MNDQLHLPIRGRFPPGHRGGSAFHRHGLSIVSGALLALWILLYSISSEKTHLGSFFGNAIADWTGSVVMILGTKYLYERGSAESRQPVVISCSLESHNHRDAGVRLFTTRL